MNSKAQSRIVSLSYLISVIGSFGLNYLKVNNIDFYGLVSAVKVSSILTIWWLFYFKVGWKIPVLNKVLYRINLRGTWYGKYRSISPESQVPYTGNIVLRINQDFLNLSIISYTRNYKNYSYSEELRYEEKSNTHGLVYVYSQKENNPLDLNERNGTSDLKVIKYEDTYKLEGEFWTILGSKGKLEVVKVSSKIVDSYKDGQNLYSRSKYTI
ncbi:hypothetical protein [Clostridium sp. BNL1100]|uniref:Cap15 family cyclic dinucleotide receptor domain-containing protein n=1 Tax=Clostridium sp. BNL1100 TaxID=755731 RepID=UPI00024A76CC|nr:hypothetical protein [Clostridium sp. BNL1100]AEY65607.1 hypothetical protein Clo1100_1371 [Clostridium sp. BNL1100]